MAVDAPVHTRMYALWLCSNGVQGSLKVLDVDATASYLLCL